MLEIYTEKHHTAVVKDEATWKILNQTRKNVLEKNSCWQLLSNGNRGQCCLSDSSPTVKLFQYKAFTDKAS